MVKSGVLPSRRLEPTLPWFNNLLILLAALILLVEFNRKLRQVWLQHLLSQKRKAKRPRKPPVLRPKSERDCRFCQEDGRIKKDN